jgi:hypothetical protein
MQINSQQNTVLNTRQNSQNSTQYDINTKTNFNKPKVIKTQPVRIESEENFIHKDNLTCKIIR